MNAGISNWYAIQTKPRDEEKAVSFLSRKGIPTFLPRLLAERRHGSRRWPILEPLFPGYLFAQFAPEPQLIQRVRWTPGVKRVLGDDTAPIPVPEDVVSYLQERVRDRGFIEPGPSFLPGMRVRFTGGPLVLLEGIVVRLTPRADRVRVLLELLNQHVSVEININQLERA